MILLVSSNCHSFGDRVDQTIYKIENSERHSLEEKEVVGRRRGESAPARLQWREMEEKRKEYEGEDMRWRWRAERGTGERRCHRARPEAASQSSLLARAHRIQAFFFLSFSFSPAAVPRCSMFGDEASQSRASNGTRERSCARKNELLLSRKSRAMNSPNIPKRIDAFHGSHLIWVGTGNCRIPRSENPPQFSSLFVIHLRTTAENNTTKEILPNYSISSFAAILLKISMLFPGACDVETSDLGLDVPPLTVATLYSTIERRQQPTDDGGVMIGEAKTLTRVRFVTIVLGSVCSLTVVGLSSLCRLQ